MGLKASIEQHELLFKKPATTSRGAYNGRQIYLLKIYNEADPNCVGIGECAPLKGLSIDDLGNYADYLNDLVEQINNNHSENFPFHQFPSIQFGIETALLDLKHGGKRIIFPNFYAIGKQGIPINGLVWMDTIDQMQLEAEEKIKKGFNCLKFKIGALNFDDELALIKNIRQSYNEQQLMIRLDANGAFSPETALDQLKALSEFKIHSIEQPIASHQRSQLRDLIQKSPIPIALDEELIGIQSTEDIDALLKEVKPPYIVLKPNLLGGFKQCDAWIKAAKQHGIKWWLTSALESNIGLNAIAQYAANFQNPMHSGLGTGQLYKTNFTPNTRIIDGYLWRDMGQSRSDQ